MFAALPKIALTEAALMRAGHVQEQLVQRGHHRGVKIPDLLIAAAAEAAGIRVLHYDHDYDLIASITGQDVAWVVDKGSVS
jgi:predicted nucleic acid-binding protein